MKGKKLDFLLRVNLFQRFIIIFRRMNASNISALFPLYLLLAGVGVDVIFFCCVCVCTTRYASELVHFTLK